MHPEMRPAVDRVHSLVAEVANLKHELTLERQKSHHRENISLATWLESISVEDGKRVRCMEKVWVARVIGSTVVCLELNMNTEFQGEILGPSVLRSIPAAGWEMLRSI